jgi:hypothetical protein
MKCRLCLREAELVKSHIIRESMYEYSGLYDKKRHFFKIKRTKETEMFQGIRSGNRI